MRVCLLDKTYAGICQFGVSIKHVSFRFKELQLQMHQLVQAHRLPNYTIAKQFEEGAKASHLLGSISQNKSVKKVFECLANCIVAVSRLVQIFELNVELNFDYWFLGKLSRIKSEPEWVLIRIQG